MTTTHHDPDHVAVEACEEPGVLDGRVAGLEEGVDLLWPLLVVQRREEQRHHVPHLPFSKISEKTQKPVDRIAGRTVNRMQGGQGSSFLIKGCDRVRCMYKKGRVLGRQNGLGGAPHPAAIPSPSSPRARPSWRSPRRAAPPSSPPVQCSAGCPASCRPRGGGSCSHSPRPRARSPPPPRPPPHRPPHTHPHPLHRRTEPVGNNIPHSTVRADTGGTERHLQHLENVPALP